MSKRTSEKMRELALCEYGPATQGGRDELLSLADRVAELERSVAPSTDPLGLLGEASVLLTEARGFVRRDGDNDRGLSHRMDALLRRISDNALT